MQQLPLALVESYASLFVHTWQHYAVQQRDGSYLRVTEPLSLPLLAAHLEGQCTLGTYLLDQQSRCAFAVFDADREGGLAQMAALALELAQVGIPTLLEASRRGGHLWVHLAAPAPAALVRAWLLPFAQALEVEFYPKQERLAPGGFGSLIRLPLGVHRRSRGWYPFLAVQADGSLVAVGETVAECCAWVCCQVQRVEVPAGVMPVGSLAMEERDRVLSLGWSAPMASRKRVGSIRQWCQAQDIVAVISRYVALDGQGRGSCPFKEHHHRGDVRPSFQVFGGHDAHWYCYTWQRAGDLFEFLCLYYRLPPQAMWQRIQQERW